MAQTVTISSIISVASLRITDHIKDGGVCIQLSESSRVHVLFSGNIIIFLGVSSQQAAMAFLHLMEDNQMNAKALIFAGCAVLMLGGVAQAGPCSEQISSLTKLFASKDAGTGPTSGGGSARTTSSEAGQHPPTTAMSEQTQGIATSPEDVRRQTAGQPPAAQQTTGTAKEHPPTAAMDQATQSQAAPPGGQPPTAAMSAATESQMPPRETSAVNMPEASMALERAREFDRQGNEADCMNSVGEAKRLSGS